MLTISAAWGAQESGFDEHLRSWEQIAGQARAGLDNDFRETDIGKTKGQLQTALSDINTVHAAASKELTQAEAELAQLGESPKGEDGREDVAVAKLRSEVDQRVTRLSGQITRSKRMEAQISKLLEAIAWQEQRRFREQLLNRGPATIHLDTWRVAWANSLELGESLLAALADWWEKRVESGLLSVEFLLVIVMPLLGLLAGWPIRLWIISHLGRDPEDGNPTYARRIIGALGDGLANAVIPVVMIGLVLLGLRQQGLLAGDMGVLVAAAALAVAVYLMVIGLARAAISPSLVAWRILPVEPVYGNKLLRCIRWLAAVMAGTGFLIFILLRTGVYSAALDAVLLLLQTMVIAVLGNRALRPRYWASSVAHSQAMGSMEDATAAQSVQVGPHQTATAAGQPPQAKASRWLNRMRAMLRLLLLLAPFAALIGYSRLAYFTQSRLLATAALVGFALLLAIAGRELLERFFSRRQECASKGTDQVANSVHGMVFWFSLLTNLLLGLLLVSAVLLIHGVPPLALGLWARDILSGIEIGGVTIAPWNLITALVLVAITLGLTNLLRRWLTSHVLPNTKLDYGARNSIVAGTSYLGVGIAMLLALTAFGLNFTNLALIAGALSLGIGFGLRNAVENFAAGVLLLIERPIKVGDWIVVGDTEGTVRQISVRSTEIETFDRASVIVPNSELVSTSVTNWTHKHRMARIIIKVGVAYDSDTELVIKTLLGCAAQHPKVLQLPSSAAYLVGFGEFALNFELRVYIGDTDDFLEVQSDLHLAVHRAFRVQEIIIPNPMRDIFVHRQSEPATDEGRKAERGGAL